MRQCSARLAPCEAPRSDLQSQVDEGQRSRAVGRAFCGAHKGSRPGSRCHKCGSQRRAWTCRSPYTTSLTPHPQRFGFGSSRSRKTQHTKTQHTKTQRLGAQSALPGTLEKETKSAMAQGLALATHCSSVLMFSLFASHAPFGSLLQSPPKLVGPHVPFPESSVTSEQPSLPDSESSRGCCTDCADRRRRAGGGRC